MEVVKNDGEREAYSEEKVIRSIVHTGADAKTAGEVLARVTPRVTDGMTTRELYAIVREELKKTNVCFGCRYDLREAIIRLGPTGFPFERYFSAILREEGYDAEVPEGEIPGACVMHEVDGLAKKDGKLHFIECKFRQDATDYVDLKNAMATWARFLDLVDGYASGKNPYPITDPWLVTNAAFSDRAEQFGRCKGIRLIGWHLPKERPLSQIVKERRMWPVTILNELTPKEMEAFSRHEIMLCSELAGYDPDDLAERLDLSLARAEALIRHAGEIIGE